MKRTLLALALLGSACKTTVDPTAGQDEPAKASVVVDGPSRLYARDGSVVEASSGATTVQDAPPRAVGERDGSRTYLLELYQKAMDDKDALVSETQALQAQLDAERKLREVALAERDAAAARATAAEAAAAQKDAEVRDLSGRLVQAQIKRLEAEKLLLEHLIAADAVKGAATTTAGAPGDASTPATEPATKQADPAPTPVQPQSGAQGGGR